MIRIQINTEDKVLIKTPNVAPVSTATYQDKGAPVRNLSTITMPNFLISGRPTVMNIPPKHLPLKPTNDEKANSYSLSFISPSGRVAKWARVFSRPRYGACAVHGEWGHDSWVFLGTEERQDAQFIDIKTVDNMYDYPDIDWPAECECGTPFTGRDIACIHTRMLFTDGEDEFLPEDAAIGSLVDTPYAPVNTTSSIKHEDGHCLSLITPSGWWPLDVPDMNGNRWNRTPLVKNLKQFSVIQGLVFDSFRGYVLNGVLFPYMR